MIFNNRLLGWLAILVVTISGCSHGQAANAFKTPNKSQTEQLQAANDALRGIQLTIGPTKDYAAAYLAFRKAADEGSVVAQYSVGQCLEAGKGVPQDETQAVVWYRKAAEQGFPAAKARLRTMFVRGQLNPRLDGQAGEWWRALAQQAANESQSFNRERAAALEGSADAEVKLGMDYLTGVGVPKDRSRATSIFQQAAIQGQPNAQCLAGALEAADENWALPLEAKRAAELCLDAANHGYADAELIVAALFTTGRGIPKDASKAAFWHGEAAKLGRPEAEFLLAYDYERGDGVPKDDTQNRIWMSKAADLKYPPAMTSLALDTAVAHSTGKQGPLDYPKQMQEYLDYGVEHGVDAQRELLQNLWASSAKEEKRQLEQKKWSRALAPFLKATGTAGP